MHKAINAFLLNHLLRFFKPNSTLYGCGVAKLCFIARKVWQAASFEVMYAIVYAHLIIILGRNLDEKIC